MDGWKTRMRFWVVVPGKEDGEFFIWAENRFDARNKAVEELNGRFESWDRAYLTDWDGNILNIIYNHNPTKEEIAVANIVYELGDALNVPFFEWLFKLIDLMGDAPEWEASYSYPSHSVRVELDRVKGVLRVTVWEQEEREAEAVLE